MVQMSWHKTSWCNSNGDSVESLELLLAGYNRLNLILCLLECRKEEKVSWGSTNSLPGSFNAFVSKSIIDWLLDALHITCQTQIIFTCNPVPPSCIWFIWATCNSKNRDRSNPKPYFYLYILTDPATYSTPFCCTTQSHARGNSAVAVY